VDTKTAEIIKRIQAINRMPAVVPAAVPKGLPEAKDNENATDPEYPIDHQTPADPGFAGSTIISGTGHGAQIGQDTQGT
jgi:hypothetical protein